MIVRNTTVYNDGNISIVVDGNVIHPGQSLITNLGPDVHLSVVESVAEAPQTGVEQHIVE